MTDRVDRYRTDAGVSAAFPVAPRSVGNPRRNARLAGRFREIEPGDHDDVVAVVRHQQRHAG